MENEEEEEMGKKLKERRLNKHKVGTRNGEGTEGKQMLGKMTKSVRPRGEEGREV